MTVISFLQETGSSGRTIEGYLCRRWDKQIDSGFDQTGLESGKNFNPLIARWSVPMQWKKLLIELIFATIKQPVKF